jgi:hypothetical protein
MKTKHSRTRREHPGKQTEMAGNRPLLPREKGNLLPGEKNHSRDRKNLSRNENDLSRDENYLSRDENNLSRDGKYLSRDETISREIIFISREIKTISREIIFISREIVSISRVIFFPRRVLKPLPRPIQTGKALNMNKLRYFLSPAPSRPAPARAAIPPGWQSSRDNRETPPVKPATARN